MFQTKLNQTWRRVNSPSSMSDSIFFETYIMRFFHEKRDISLVMEQSALNFFQHSPRLQREFFTFLHYGHSGHILGA